MPGAAELQIISYKLYEIGKKTLKVCVNYKAGEGGEGIKTQCKQVHWKDWESRKLIFMSAWNIPLLK